MARHSPLGALARMDYRTKVAFLVATLLVASAAVVWSVGALPKSPPAPVRDVASSVLESPSVPAAPTGTSLASRATYVREAHERVQTVFPIAVTRCKLDAIDALTLGKHSLEYGYVEVSRTRVSPSVEQLTIVYGNDFFCESFEFTLTCDDAGQLSAALSVVSFHDAGGTERWHDISGVLNVDGEWCAGQSPMIVQFFVEGQRLTEYVSRLAKVSLP